MEMMTKVASFLVMQIRCYMSPFASRFFAFKIDRRVRYVTAARARRADIRRSVSKVD